MDLRDHSVSQGVNKLKESEQRTIFTHILFCIKEKSVSVFVFVFVSVLCLCFVWNLLLVAVKTE